MMITYKSLDDNGCTQGMGKFGRAIFGIGLALAGSYIAYKGYTNYQEWYAALGPVAFMVGSMGQDYLGKSNE